MDIREVQRHSNLISRNPARPQLAAWVRMRQSAEGWALQRDLISRVRPGDKTPGPVPAALAPAASPTGPSSQGDGSLHQSLLGYISDMTLLDAALAPMGWPWMDVAMMVSLDHCIWFHAPFRYAITRLFSLHLHKQTHHPMLSRRRHDRLPNVRTMMRLLRGVSLGTMMHDTHDSRSTHFACMIINSCLSTCLSVGSEWTIGCCIPRSVLGRGTAGCSSTEGSTTATACWWRPWPRKDCCACKPIFSLQTPRRTCLCSNSCWCPPRGEGGVR